MKNFTQAASLILILTSLSSCGDGKSDAASKTLTAKTPTPTPAASVVNQAPVISQLSTSQEVPGKPITLQAQVSDAENDPLTFEWSATCAGTFSFASEDHSQVLFTFPAEPAQNECQLSLKVKDSHDALATSSVTVQYQMQPAEETPSEPVVEIINISPQIINFAQSKMEGGPEQEFTFSVVATDDHDQDSLQFEWTVDGGTILATNNQSPNSSITFKTDSTFTTAHASVKVSDSKGLNETQDFSVSNNLYPNSQMLNQNLYSVGLDNTGKIFFSLQVIQSSLWKIYFQDSNLYTTFDALNAILQTSSNTPVYDGMPNLNMLIASDTNGNLISPMLGNSQVLPKMMTQSSLKYTATNIKAHLMYGITSQNPNRYSLLSANTQQLLEETLTFADGDYAFTGTNVLPPTNLTIIGDTSKYTSCLATGGSYYQQHACQNMTDFVTWHTNFWFNTINGRGVVFEPNVGDILNGNLVSYPIVSGSLSKSPSTRQLEGTYASFAQNSETPLLLTFNDGHKDVMHAKNGYALRLLSISSTTTSTDVFFYNESAFKKVITQILGHL